MIKNYTSRVPAHVSISWIERVLVKHGASMVVKLYDADDDGRVTALAFEIEVAGEKCAFRLPANVAACEKVLVGNLSRRARPETVERVRDQADRTTWKILADWVDAQMALVELAQVDVAEVFLPYAYDRASDQTLYQKIKGASAGSFQRLLGAGLAQ
jgi:hypothetical protein